ncbi:MAG TPA: galactokinase family protein [Gemmatimonadales bacterium]|nr:galactokinase family protein [Gemmatimonadales bacterium]
MSDNASVVFRTAFGVAPRVVASAPGRVNLIGEHTDYNGGPVLPVATAARTSVAVGPADDGVLELISTLDGQLARIDWRDGRPAGWNAYLAGVMRELDAAGAAPTGAGARVAVASGVPVGAGLASSAALTVAAAKALSLLASVRLNPRQLAGVAFRAEHDYVGVRCGMMDQMCAALARPGQALLLECASLAARHIPIRARLLLVDTGTRHALTAGALNERRAECEAAVARLKLELPELAWLASWPARWLPRLKRALPEPLRSRALHVVGETARTRFGAQLLARGRVRRFGGLLYESHESCRHLYQCSSAELDLVVDVARRAGALGARLTGAGWGGAVLVLLGKGDGGRGKGEAKVAREIRRAFTAAYGREPSITAVRPSGGARGKRSR